MPNKWENNEEIQILQEYLRIPSVHSDNAQINYGIIKIWNPSNLKANIYYGMFEFFLLWGANNK